MALTTFFLGKNGRPERNHGGPEWTGPGQGPGGTGHGAVAGNVKAAETPAGGGKAQLHDPVFPRQCRGRGELLLLPWESP